MQARAPLALALSSLLLAACSSSSNSPRAVPAPPARNDNGTVVTGIITARFDPSAGVLPFPTNLLLSGTNDLTLNPPVANPNNINDPAVALSAMDGFSTVAPISFSFSVPPNPNSVTPGRAIRIFEVGLTGPGGAVNRVVRELAAGTEYVAGVSSISPTTVGVLPTAPLKQLSSYMVIVTDDITDAAGNDATPDTTYFLTQRTAPLCVGGQSTDPLIPSANACALEPLRQLTNAQEAAAAGAGIPRSEIVLSFVFTTQSVTPTLLAVRGLNPPGTTRVASAGLTLGQLGIGLPPVADIFIGTIDLPYYLDAPTSPANAAVILGTFWRAAPGAYIPPFNTAGLSPTSTNVTFANPVPVRRSVQTVPLLLTVPNAASGRTRPAAGWPIVIFNHGITRNRTDLFAIAATLAAQGFAVIAIDQPLHGVGSTSPFYIESTPFGPVANERTFDVDLINNATGAPGPDGRVDDSGAHYLNLASLLTARDNLRQSISDLITLAKTIPSISFDGDATPDFDGARIGFVGQSLGSIVGAGFLAVEPTVNLGVLNVPGGGIARMLDGSPTFGPRIRAALAAAGVQAGTPQYDQFMVIAQTLIDSADPVNHIASAAATDRLLMQLVVGGGPNALPDQVVPPLVAGQPLSGGEPLARVGGLVAITGTTQNAAGIRGVSRFVIGDHGSLLDPRASAGATTEMQGQAASFLASNGTAVQVTVPAAIRPN